MILAAADYALGKKINKIAVNPPPELEDYFKCELFGSLPNGKGWKHEPYKWIQRVEVFVNVYNAIRRHSDAMKRMKGKERTAWQTNNKGTLNTVLYIEKLRGTNG